MSNHFKWPLVKLSTLATGDKNSIVGGPFGSDLVSRDYVPEGVPVVRGANLPKNSIFSCNNFVFVSEHKADSLRSNCAKPGDMVFTQRGTLGQVGVIPNNTLYSRFLISQSQMKMTVDPSKADSLYLYYYFRLPSTVAYIENHALQSGVPHINLGILRKFDIVYPPLPIQNKIAAVLSAYNDLIENNKRRIALLEKMAGELYHEWFVRMRFPGHEKVKFDKGVPNGWKLKKLNEILELCYGKALKEEERIPGDYPVFGSSGIVGTHNKAHVSAPGIIVGRKGNVGSVHWTDCCFFPIDTAYYVKSNTSFYYLYFLLQSMNFINNDAAVPGLNRNQAYSNLLFFPNEELIYEFSVVAKQVFDMKSILTRQNDNLTITRDKLLPRLISGKLSIENLDIQLPPSMQDVASS